MSSLIRTNSRDKSTGDGLVALVLGGFLFHFRATRLHVLARAFHGVAGAQEEGRADDRSRSQKKFHVMPPVGPLRGAKVEFGPPSASLQQCPWWPMGGATRIRQMPLRMWASSYPCVATLRSREAVTTAA